MPWESGGRSNAGGLCCRVLLPARAAHQGTRPARGRRMDRGPLQPASLARLTGSNHARGLRDAILKRDRGLSRSRITPCPLNGVRARHWNAHPVQRSPRPRTRHSARARPRPHDRVHRTPRTLRTAAPTTTNIPHDVLDQRARKRRNKLNEPLKKLTHKG